MVAEFAEVDALPCAEVEAAVRDRQGEGRADYHRFDVRRHVVGSFVGMKVIWRVFWHESIEKHVKVMSHVRIGVLIERQRRRCMLYQ